MSLAGDQTGAAYMLPLVLTMPFYVLLITLIIGVHADADGQDRSVGAAYAAARQQRSGYRMRPPCPRMPRITHR